MFKKSLILLLSVFSFSLFAQTSNLNVKWEELTSPDFVKAIEKSEGVCIIPIGIVEKHATHLPLGTDLLDVREIAVKAAEKEYSIVFLPYYFGQIFEAKHQPGVIAYSSETIMKLLRETCDEISRNGIKKIVIINGHGGNNSFLSYFIQTQLEAKRDYAIYSYNPLANPEAEAEIAKLKKNKFDYHAGEWETAGILAFRPDLVKMEEIDKESGADLNRLNNLKDNSTAIWWYASFPNHYAGEAANSTKELGEVIHKYAIQQFAEYLKSVKADKNVMELQNQFFKESKNPLETLPKK